MKEIKEPQFSIENGTLVAFVGGGDIVIPREVKKIGSEVFKENNDLHSVDLNEVTETENRAFYNCRNLKTVTGKNVKTVGDDCFRACHNLKRITFGAVERVGSHAFFGCMYCEEIRGTNNLVEIGESAFDGTKISSMEISPNAVKIGAGAFRCCSQLKRFTVPRTIRSLESCVFAGCEALKSICLSEGLERIEHAAFFGCEFLKYIEIPSTVEFIHAQAFERCCIADVCNNSNLEIKQGKSKPGGGVASYAVHVHSPRSGRSTRELKDNYVFCTDEKTGIHYLTEYVGSDTELVLPRDFHGESYRIYRLAFGNADITSVDLGDAVTAVENLAFYNCKSLREVRSGKGLKIIDRLAFKICKNLKSIELGANVEVVGVGAFLGTGLKYMVMDKSVREIRSSAFDFCKNFKTIYYKGTPDDFDGIKITGGTGRWLKSITRFYSDSEPENSDYKFWRYTDGNISDW